MEVKEKIELGHIAGYLPWGIQAKAENRTFPIITIDGFYFSFGELCFNSKELLGGIQTEDIKLLLRPLSDIGQKITHNGETFVPIIELSKIWFYENEFSNYKYEICKDWVEVISVDSPDYTFGLNLQKDFWAMRSGEMLHIGNQIGLIKKLYEWHFDIDDLIEKGLAIDLNTLQNDKS